MFENFNVPVLSIANPGAMSLYNTDFSTGIILDCGHSGTRAIPLYEGFTIKNAVNSIDLGGQDVNLFLEKILAERRLTFVTDAERETVGEIKE